MQGLQLSVMKQCNSDKKGWGSGGGGGGSSAHPCLKEAIKAASLMSL